MATKSDIVKRVAEKYSSLDKKAIAFVVDRFLKILESALKDHNRIELRGFGSFSIRSYNLKTVSSHRLDRLTKNRYFKVYFRSSESLSNECNK